MKKLISLVLTLCMACMLFSAVAEGSGAAGVWYAEYQGAVMTLTLGEDNTASMEAFGTQLGSGTWAEKDGNIEITMTDSTGEPSTLVATLADGVLTLADEAMNVSFTQEPVEVWQPAEVNPDAALEDFAGDWIASKASMLGMTLEAEAAGLGDFGLKIENTSVSFSGTSDSVTFFTGTDPLELTYENGALSYSVDIPNDAEPMTFTMKIELLQDGMAALTIDMGYGLSTLYFTKVAAE